MGVGDKVEWFEDVKMQFIVTAVSGEPQISNRDICVVNSGIVQSKHNLLQNFERMHQPSRPVLPNRSSRDHESAL